MQDLTRYSKVEKGIDRVTGEFGVLDIIDSGSCFELDGETLEHIRKTVVEKNIHTLWFETHYMYRPRLGEFASLFPCNVKFRTGIETFNPALRTSWNKGIPEDVDAVSLSRDFQGICLLVGVRGQTEQDILDDLNDAKNHLVTESTYAKAVLSFESLVISYMKQFIAIEKQIFIAEKNLDDKTTVMDNYLKLRTATEDSLTYQKAVLDVQKARMDLDSLNQQKSLLKTQYKTVTGLDWDGLTDIPDPVLDLVPLAEGNTSVLVSSLSAQIADETVKKEESALNPQSLRLTGTLGVDVNNKLRGTRNPVNGTVSYTENMATGTVGLTYVGSNWSIGGTFGASANGSFDIKPKLTIAGSWTSDSNSDEDNDKLQTLRNNALISRNTYSNDLLAYNNEALQYSTEISSYMFQVEQLKSNMDYYAKLLEFEKESFDKGLSSQSDLDNAQYNYDLLKYDEATTKLDGLDLENRIKTFAI